MKKTLPAVVIAAAALVALAGPVLAAEGDPPGPCCGPVVPGPAFIEPFDVD